ncbi:dihydroorotate dehydrogenase [Novipirellula galeiformis]|nr:dihydroorotate dehydrogenase [Novipirellula galeiformis]
MTLDLTTNYGGLRLRTPIVVGACPLTANEQTRMALENAGAGAVVLPSLFEEHVVSWNHRRGHTSQLQDPRELDRLRENTRDTVCPDAETYLAMVNRASIQLSIPVIASLNGATDGDWLDFAGELQDAGAAAIELNIHHSPARNYQGPRELEDKVVDLAKSINNSITVPLFLKLNREYTSVCHLARRLLSGAQGLVLYGRDPNVDITLDNCQVKTHWGLTQPGSIGQTLGALMSVYGYCPAMPLAGSGGIGSPEDFIKVLLAGADVGMVVSAVYREGPDVIRTMLDGLMQFMEQNQLGSLNEIQAKRPLEFSSEEERMNCIRQFSTRPDWLEINAANRNIQGDRWGHPQRCQPQLVTSPPPPMH